MHDSGQYNDSDDEEEEDAMMQYARQQSVRQIKIDSYRRTKGIHYDAGGSSDSQQRKQMMSRFSVSETLLIHKLQKATIHNLLDLLLLNHQYQLKDWELLKWI